MWKNAKIKQQQNHQEKIIDMNVNEFMKVFDTLNDFSKIMEKSPEK